MNDIVKVGKRALARLDELGELGRTELLVIEQSGRTLVEHSIRLGEIMLEAKRMVGHGGWEKFVREELGMHPRNAWRYMEAARVAAEDPDQTRVSDMALRHVRKGSVLPTPARAPDETVDEKTVREVFPGLAAENPTPTHEVVDATAVEIPDWVTPGRAAQLHGAAATQLADAWRAFTEANGCALEYAAETLTTAADAAARAARSLKQLAELAEKAA